MPFLPKDLEEHRSVFHPSVPELCYTVILVDYDEVIEEDSSTKAKLVITKVVAAALKLTEESIGKFRDEIVAKRCNLHHPFIVSYCRAIKGLPALKGDIKGYQYEQVARAMEDIDISEPGVIARFCGVQSSWVKKMGEIIGLKKDPRKKVYRQTAANYSEILCLLSDGPMLVSEIHQELNLASHKRSVNRIMVEMEKDGLVERCEKEASDFRAHKSKNLKAYEATNTFQAWRLARGKKS
jgi:hypothetical protein